MGATAAADQLVEGLAREHGPALMRYFLRKGFTPADAEDGTQEVMFRLARRADLLSDIDSLQGYLFTTAAHVATDVLRQSNRRRLRYHEPFEDARHAGLDHGPDDILESQQALSVLFLALNELPQKTRAIFVLARLEHMSQVEIARRLGVALSTVEKHIAKAAAYLAERVDRS